MACLAAALAAGCAAGAEDHLAKGNRFLADGKVEDARAEFRVALRRAENPPEDLLWKAGLLDLETKNFTGAREAFEALARREPDERGRVARAYLLFASRWFGAGDAFNATQAIEAARAADPSRNLGPYYYEMGDYHFGIPDYERAAESYLLGLALAPGVDPEARYRLALALERLGRWRQAAGHFRAYASAAAPEGRPRELAHHMGESAYRSAEASFLGHRYHEAVEDLQVVLDAGQPQSRLDDAWYLLGEIRFRSGDAGGAASAFERVLELSPSSSSRLYGEAERRLLDIRIGGSSLNAEGS